MRNWKLRHKLLLVWAMALAFSLGFQVSKAEAMHASCESQCSRSCGSGNCSAWEQDGCSCFWVCSGGGGGSSICV